jgi:hypothetical protein
MAVLIFSIFSTTLNVLPWFCAFLITLLPVLYYEMLLHFRSFLRQGILAVVVFFLLNFYWIFHFINAAVHSSGAGSSLQYYASNSFVADNLRIVMGVSRTFSPLAIPFQNLFSQTHYEFWPVLLLTSLPFLVIILGGFFAMLRKDIRYIYYIELFSFLLAWFLFSPNLGSWGPKLFLSLAIHIPFFTMFRNMFDKFSLSLSFHFAFVFGIALTLLLQQVKRSRYLYGIVFVLLFSIITTLSTSYADYRSAIRSQGVFSGEFNSDYMALTNYLASFHNASHVLWIPLNEPTYANIADESDDRRYYSGLSPLQELTGMPDYAGRFSFIRQKDLFYGDKLFAAIEQKDYETAGRMLQGANVRYIVLDQQKLPDQIANFMYGGNDQKIFLMQDSHFKTAILGEKLRDFGSTYSVYKISPRFDNDKIYLSSSTNDFIPASNQLSYKQLSSAEYNVNLSLLKARSAVYFLEPFDKRWILGIKDKNGHILPLPGAHSEVLGYANGWIISPDAIRSLGTDFYIQRADGSISVDMTILFTPLRYNILIYSVSGVTFLFIIVFCMWSALFAHRKRHENS